MKAVTVIGMGDEGCLGLSSIAANAVSNAQVLAGGKRHLDFFSPIFRGKNRIEREHYGSDRKNRRSCLRTFGMCTRIRGPSFFGIGSLISKKLDRNTSILFRRRVQSNKPLQEWEFTGTTPKFYPYTEDPSKVSSQNYNPFIRLRCSLMNSIARKRSLPIYYLSRNRNGPLSYAKISGTKRKKSANSILNR